MKNLYKKGIQNNAFYGIIRKNRKPRANKAKAFLAGTLLQRAAV